MSKFQKDYDYIANNSIVSGNSLDLDFNKCESEIRADIVVSEYSSVRLWGRIVNCEGKPVANALVKLLKVESDGNKVYYSGISHTVSDCEGFYQFDLCTNSEDAHNTCYKVLVSKAAYGVEKVIPGKSLNCQPCQPQDTCTQCFYDDCNDSNQIPQSELEYGFYNDNDYHCGCNSGRYNQKSKF